VTQKKAHDQKASPHAFFIGQQVLVKVHTHVNKNHKFAAKWTGPGVIKEIQAHRAWVALKNKTKTFNLHNLKPYTSQPEEFNLQGKEAGPADPEDQTADPAASPNPSVINYANCNQTDNVETREAQAKRILEVIGINQREIDPYLTELHLRVLRSQPTDPPALTPHERAIYDAIPAWERNLRTAGSPLEIPEFRYHLIRMPGRTEPAPAAPAPMAPPPALPVPAPGPAVPVQAAPEPRPAPRNTRMGRGSRRDITPSDRRLRSAGPAAEAGPLPKRIATRPRTPTPVRDESAPAAEEDYSLFGKVSRLGWALLAGGRRDEADSGNVSRMDTSQPPPSNPGDNRDPGDDWSFC
jgi:hypothetical protein